MRLPLCSRPISNSGGRSSGRRTSSPNERHRRLAADTHRSIAINNRAPVAPSRLTEITRASANDMHEQDRNQSADRRRRPRRTDARLGSRLARGRCHRRRASPAWRTAERQMQPDLRPLHGDFSPPRDCRESCGNAGLPADYPNDVVSATTRDRDRARARSNSLRGPSATPQRYGPDTSWPTPEPTHRINQIYFEPVLFACAASHPRIRHSQPHGRRRFRAGRTRCHGDCPQSRQQRATFDCLHLSCRLRRRQVDGPQSDRRQACRHARTPARAINLYPGAGAYRPAARKARMDVFFAQSAPLRNHDRNRWAGNVAISAMPS